MASTQKKTTKGKKAPPKPEPPAYNGMARLIGGIVCLLLALCVLVSYFNVDALLLTFIAKALKGTLGCGYYLAAPALLGVAVIQLRHQGRPVILRTTCTLLVPLLAGVLCGLFGVGALLAAYVSRVTEDGGSFKANISAVFIVDNTFRIVLYSALGLLTFDTLKTALLLLPFALAGLFLGMKCSSRMNESLVKKITSILLVLSGISLILKNL